MTKGKVLVVDDDPSIVSLLTDILEDDDYEVISASGGQALTLARAAHPSAILLDLMMPVMDGREVSRRLRADTATSDIPIIVMSAQRDLRSAVAGMKVNDCLAKPFDLDDVSITVAHWANASGQLQSPLRWRDMAGRSYAFDRQARRVVAWCMSGAGTRWWTVIRQSSALHGPFASRGGAKADAESILLA